MSTLPKISESEWEIPSYVLHMRDKKQLSYIFLHELTHYKRKDLIYNFFAVNKMNLWRECACDACVLELLNEEENVEYGMALLNLSKLYIDTRCYTQLPVFFETKSDT